MLMSLTSSLFILGVILVVGWFAIGTQYNVRKGHAVMRWLQDGLPVIGEKTNLRWLGSSVVELTIQRARSPFRTATVMVVLEPRDVAPLWAFARLRNRRDLFIFRAVLQTTPPAELEVLDPTAWSTRRALQQVKIAEWTQLSAPPPLVAYVLSESPAASDLISAAKLDGCPLVRLAIHRAEPHVEVQWLLDPLRRHSAGEVFDTLKRLAERT